MNSTHAAATKSCPQITQPSAPFGIAPRSLMACALGGMLALGSLPSAQAQEVIPDAQVQANVLKALGRGSRACGRRYPYAYGVRRGFIDRKRSL